MRKMLTLADREEISRGLAENLEYKQIAVLIGRNPSVVHRRQPRYLIFPELHRLHRCLLSWECESV